MNKFSLVLLFLFSWSGFSQNISKITDEDKQLAKELKQKFDDEELIILSKKTDVSFHWDRGSKKVEAVVKNTDNILNISPSHMHQYPVFYDAESSVDNFKVLDNKRKNSYSSIQDEYLKSNDLFHTDYRVKYALLTFPVQGYKVYVSYHKKYNDVKYFTNFYFSQYSRVQNGKLEVFIPNWLEVEIKEFNIEGFDITKKETKTDKGIKIIYTYKNIPPIIEEDNKQGPSHIYPHLLFIAKNYTLGGKKTRLFEDTSDLYKWYNSLVKEVEVDASVFSKKVSELTQHAKTDKEKIENIFYWVQDNIRYIAFEDGIAGFKPATPQEVFEKKYGDCKGMAILTANMLQEAGFDSRLVWIGTDRLAYNYSIPSLSVDNHMICAVKLDGETIFLDSTEKYSKLGEYASRIQNKEALIQNGEDYEIIKITPPKIENIEKTTYHLSLKNEKLIGEATRSLKGEARVFFQNIYNSFGKSDKEENLKVFLTGENNNFFIETVQPFEEEKRAEELTIDYSVSIANAVSEFDGTYYIDINPIKTFENWIFENRKNDFKLFYTRKNIVELHLLLPEKYSEIELPKNISVSNKLLDISVNYNTTESELIFKTEVNFKQRIIKKEDFELWNQSFTALKENLSEQIILTK